MKLIVFSFVFSFVGTAFATTSVEVPALSVINYDGQTLSFVYQTGGGCQKHTPEVKVDLKATADKNINAAVVRVLDTTPAPDFCEAFISVKGTVNLQQLISDEAKAAGIKSNYFIVTLPGVVLSN